MEKETRKEKKTNKTKANKNKQQKNKAKKTTNLKSFMQKKIYIFLSIFVTHLRNAIFENSRYPA